MSYVLAIVLGIIQGIAEFLPISSTAHLLIAEHFLGTIPTPENSFEVAVQSGSALALLILFAPKIMQLKKSFLLPYILALIPAVVLGALFSSTIKYYLYGPSTFSWSLILGGLVMIWTEKKAQKPCLTELESVQPSQGFSVGLMQAIALIPGVSRLGATLVGARLLGFDRKTAVEFSLLLAIPILFGATLHDLVKHLNVLSMHDIGLMSTGALSALATGLLVLKPCMKALIQYGLTPFGWYRIGLGIAITLF